MQNNIDEISKKMHKNNSKKMWKFCLKLKSGKVKINLDSETKLLIVLLNVETSIASLAFAN